MERGLPGLRSGIIWPVEVMSDYTIARIKHMAAQISGDAGPETQTKNKHTDKMTPKFQPGALVRSRINPSQIYRVQRCGLRRAVLVLEAPIYFRCYCSPAILFLAE